MASAPIALKVSNRPGKKPVRKLPATVEINSNTTIDDVKKIVAKAAGISDYNRIAIRDPTKQIIIKDRNALVSEQKAVMEAKEFMVADLGPQIAWKTVFIIEYFGPILIHLLPLVARPYLYRGITKSSALSSTQFLAMGMIVVHFLKREFETLFVHKFSASTMPAFNIFKNSFHYWVLAGLNIAYWIYSPNALIAQPEKEGLSSLCIPIGVTIYGIGEIANMYTHIVLSNLRSPGGTERGIPKGFSFSWVTCPNYMWEIIAWFGILLVTRSLGTVVFIAVAWWQMQVWSIGKEKRYREEFGDTYKPKLFPLTPGVAYPIRKSRK